MDRDNYLLEVSRYVHLNAVAAGVVKRPGKYPWSSYASYLRGNGIPGLKYQKVLGYFAGGRRKQVAEYREFIEGGLGGKGEVWEPAVRKQVFIGDEEFEEEARHKARSPVTEQSYGLKRIVGAVCKITGISESEVKRSGRSEEVQAARELICYLSRRHGTASLAKLCRFLGVKELSTPSHALRRAERRLTEDRGFGRQLRRVLDVLNSSMDSAEKPLRFFSVPRLGPLAN